MCRSESARPSFFSFCCWCGSCRKASSRLIAYRLKEYDRASLPWLYLFWRAYDLILCSCVWSGPYSEQQHQLRPWMEQQSKHLSLPYRRHSVLASWKWALFYELWEPCRLLAFLELQVFCELMLSSLVEQTLLRAANLPFKHRSFVWVSPSSPSI